MSWWRLQFTHDQGKVWVETNNLVIDARNAQLRIVSATRSHRPEY